MTSKYALRNFNKGLVESLELGQNRLVVSLENLKTKYKSQREIDETIKELAKTPPRPKRKKQYRNTYHVNEGDSIWNGSVINNVNDISVKPAIIHDRKSTLSTKIEKGGCRNPRIITRKMKKCEETYPPARKEDYYVPKIAVKPTQATQPTIESNLDINYSDDSYEESIPEVNITKPSQRGTFKEIIQKSKKQKRELKNENVFEENLRDTYLKRLIDSGNTRSKNNLSKNSESQIKPESDFWNTRGKPLLGYDFIAGTLDNSKISVLSLPEKYFEKLQKFRSENKNECYPDEKTVQKDDNKMEENFKNEEAFNSPKCVHTRRLVDGKSLCNICEIVVKTKNKYPSFDSAKRNGPRRNPKLREKIKFDQFDPKSMALKRNCSFKKIDPKIGCTLGHR